jgi:hypothetical protein
MIIFIVLSSFLVGVITSLIAFWGILPSRRNIHSDYKQRWEGAVSLLQQAQILASSELTTQNCADGIPEWEHTPTQVLYCQACGRDHTSDEAERLNQE